MYILSSDPSIKVVGMAFNGEEAIEAVGQLKPDVVILDIRMPCKSGIEVLKELKKDKATLVVIILTNFPYPQYRKRCMELGAKYFFDKSNEFERVREVMEQLIRDSKI